MYKRGMAPEWAGQGYVYKGETSKPQRHTKTTQTCAETFSIKPIPNAHQNSPKIHERCPPREPATITCLSTRKKEPATITCLCTPPKKLHLSPKAHQNTTNMSPNVLQSESYAIEGHQTGPKWAPILVPKASQGHPGLRF